MHFCNDLYFKNECTESDTHGGSVLQAERSFRARAELKIAL